MRVGRRSVWFAVVPLLCLGVDASGQNAANPAPPQEAKQQATPPAAQGGKAVVPEPGKPADPETDPSKMARSSQAPAAPADPSYVIGAEDVLGIQVWGDPRLSGTFLVRPDGRISMSLIGEVMATGLTPGQLETSIADALKAKDILKKPQVAVQVTAINSKKYYLQGEVLRTGAFPLVVPTRVLEALVNAGGFKDFANVKKIEIIRGTERFRFNYKDVIHGKHTEQNIWLKPGDIIIVP